MCGIVGIISEKLFLKETDKALNIIKHRGPDAQKIINFQNNSQHIILAHARLRIIDLNTNADQPFFSNDKNFIIVYNGEIYNFKELREELQGMGYRFNTQSDTEVLLNGFIEYREKILNKLEGIFAFAIYDKNKDILFLARDQLGVKPLYYYYDEQESHFIFSSEIKAILQYPCVKTSINKELLGEYLANMWVQEPNTMFKNIFKLPSANYIIFKNGKISIKEYWYPYSNKNNNNVNFFEGALSNSIKKELVSDVPLGLFFSGGVDSSLIAHYMLQSREQITTLTSCYKKEDRIYEGYSDDKSYSDYFINLHRKQIVSNFMKLDVENEELYEKLIWYLDEPISDPAIIPAYLLSKEAKKVGLTVMLSGMGADEVFAGYPRYSAVLLGEKYRKMFSNRAIKELIIRILSIIEMGNNTGNIRKICRDGKRFINFAHLGFPRGYLNLMGHFSEQEISSLLGHKNWFTKYTDRCLSTINNFEGDILDKVILYELKGFLASHNLLYMDKMSMANSIEVRVPLISKSLVELSFALNREEKIKNSEGKIILKKFLSQYYDKNFVYRNKAGFGSPIRIWLKNKTIKNKIFEAFNSNELLSLFDKRKLNLILIKHYEKNIDSAYQIWTLYTLYLWRKTFKI